MDAHRPPYSSLLHLVARAWDPTPSRRDPKGAGGGGAAAGAAGGAAAGGGGPGLGETPGPGDYDVEAETGGIVEEICQDIPECHFDPRFESSCQ